jgi:hypothetical protein
MSFQYIAKLFLVKTQAKKSIAEQHYYEGRAATLVLLPLVPQQGTN